MTYQFFTQANAQEVAAPAAADASQFSVTSFIPLILIFTVFYFLIIRPQSKKFKDHQALVNNLKIGDKVITNGGIIGVVRHIHDKENILEVEISDDVNIKILRSYVSDLVKKEEKTEKKKK